jgi:hypothetical protein
MGDLENIKRATRDYQAQLGHGERSLSLSLRFPADAAGDLRAEVAAVLEDVAQRIRDGETLPMDVFDETGIMVGAVFGNIDGE